MQRCNWVSQEQLYIDYHDKEWGVPVTNSKKLFEMICLEGQQAGLSWITVLKKRENYRKLFRDFDPILIAEMTKKDLETILLNPRIIRHQGKIQAIVENARAWISMEKGGERFSDFIWQFVNYSPKINQVTSLEQIPISTPISNALSKALKKRGFRFVGSTVCYSFMQACGLINDHITSCFRYPEIKKDNFFHYKKNSFL